MMNSFNFWGTNIYLIITFLISDKSTPPPLQFAADATAFSLSLKNINIFVTFEFVFGVMFV